MSQRQRKRIIWLAAAVVAASSVAVLIGGLLLPVRVAADGPAARAGAPGADDPIAGGAARNMSTRRAVTLADLQRVCGVDLRRPLGEAPPAAGAASGAPAASPMTLRLVGTVNEPGHSVAMFQKPDGAMELCGLGQSIDDAGGAVTVTRIEAQKVTVQYGSQVLELAVAPTP